MLKDALISFKPSVQNIFQDKVNFILAMIPIIIGIALYALLASWIYGSLMDQGSMWIKDFTGEGTTGGVLSFILATIFTVLLYFVVNWTFVLIVTVVASPFNDMLSKRTERKMKGLELESFASSFGTIGTTFFKTIFNEIKKITFIIVLSLIAFTLGYIPLLTPISLIITVLLLSVGFVDYSWSRHNIPFKMCFSDLKSNLLNYGFGGTFFFVLISIPVVNLIVSPWATSYFTMLWVKNNEHSN